MGHVLLGKVSPMNAAPLHGHGVRPLGTRAGRAANSSVVRVDAEASLDHQHTVMELVAAKWICQAK